MTPLAILKELVSIASVNPMGRELNPSEMYESRVSEYLVGLFNSHNMQCERIEVQPGRSNVVARVEGTAGMPTILLDAHQDTVPVDGMSIHPFEPLECDGRLYGRGACDVKGGMAAMICALDRLSSSAQVRRPTVVMACTCDEELDQLGAQSIVGSLEGGPGHSLQLLPSLPDMAVVAEPTKLNVGIAHRGVVRWKLCTKGVAAHSSDPRQGENAIYRMARLLNVIEQYAASLDMATPIRDDYCGPPALSVGVIACGECVNIVPAWCSIEIDRRTLPSEQASQVMMDLDSHLRERVDFEFEMKPPTTVAPGLSPEHNSDLAAELLQASRTVCSSSRIAGLPFTTHAPRYALAGIPTVVFGPGSIEQAHTCDEWIAIEQLEQATEILYRFLCSFK